MNIKIYIIILIRKYLISVCLIGQWKMETSQEKAMEF